jgi:hypothetical protein
MPYANARQFVIRHVSECAAPEDADGNLHARLNRLRTLIGTLRDVEYEDDRVDDVWAASSTVWMACWCYPVMRRGW